MISLLLLIPAVILCAFIAAGGVRYYYAGDVCWPRGDRGQLSGFAARSRRGGLAGGAGIGLLLALSAILTCLTGIIPQHSSTAG